MKIVHKLIPPLVALAATAAFAGPAAGGTVGPAELLPDLDQEAPANLQLFSSGTGVWRLGFSSEVTNTGTGPLRIDGHGGGGADIPMTADQVVTRDDNSTWTYPAVGTLRWTPGGGHNHWHLLDFEHYELRAVEDPDTIAADHKTGFCLTDAFDTDRCGLNQPTRTSLSEGIGVGGSDFYGPMLEGQYVEVSKTALPTARYYLVHRTNGDAALHEETLSNNAASLLLNVSWPTNAAGPPRLQTVRSCPDTPECPPQPGDPEPAPFELPQPPPPQPNPEPKPQPGTPQPQPQPEQQTTPTSLPQDVPLVAAPPAMVSRTTAQMTRAQAIDLMKKAIGRATRGKAKRVQTACGRRNTSSFACRVTWTQAGKAWRGKGAVSYRVVAGSLRWYYDLDARGGQGSRRLKRGSVRGPLGFAASARGGASMLCAPLPKV